MFALLHLFCSTCCPNKILYFELVSDIHVQGRMKNKILNWYLIDWFTSLNVKLQLNIPTNYYHYSEVPT